MQGSRMIQSLNDIPLCSNMSPGTSPLPTPKGSIPFWLCRSLWFGEILHNLLDEILASYSTPSITPSKRRS